jgi:hypothetical protein
VRQTRSEMEKSFTELLDEIPEIELQNWNEQLQSSNLEDQKSVHQKIKAKLK